MQEKAAISSRQFIILVALFTVGSAILAVPSSLAALARQDAWFAAMAGLIAGMLLVWLYGAIGKRFPHMTLIEIMETLLGKWLGKTVSLLFIVSLFLAGPVVGLFFVGNFITTEFMVQTPIQAIYILFTIIIVMGARLGLETIARSSEILFPFVCVLFMLLVLFIAPQIKLDNALPFMETGVKPILLSVLSFLSYSILPDIILLMIFPYVDKPNEAQKAFFTGNVIAGLILTLITALSILVLGPELSEGNMFPSYALARKINIGQFFQRIEAFMAAIWFISLYFRLTLYVYATVIAAAQIFGLKNYRPLVMPVGGILIVLALVVSPNVTYMQTWDTKTWVPYTVTIGFLMPLLLLIVAKFRK
ncbi:GerAB/ArcD/ProY family transporter [Paenibacillus thalictri]|uniref:Spore gernimation protein n=1 Tax=Paenibacillus thalictri TaxID=2527873 RepID=A0A4Q9DVR5_9BACL|nr:endospore germination permease [Paenibacillus thalictri]TBL81147.1 spore gernimation protein [Paenibacillus thalictri]